MNRRGFFAALLAPLVVPWRPTRPLIWEGSTVAKWAYWPRRFDHALNLETNRRMNELYNQRIDNITLGCLPDQDLLDKLAEFDLDDRSLWGKRLR